MNSSWRRLVVDCDCDCFCLPVDVGIVKVPGDDYVAVARNTIQCIPEGTTTSFVLTVRPIEAADIEYSCCM